MPATKSAPSRVTAISGDLLVGDQGELFSTTLGSCVAVAIWFERLKVGGLVHYLLPRAPGDEKCDNDNLYGEMAIRNLLLEFKKRGAAPSDLRAWVVGGAISAENTVGDLNVALAKQFLDRFGISYSDKATGGQLGRVMEFDVGTGHVRYRVIGSTHETKTLSTIGSMATEIRPVVPETNSETRKEKSDFQRIKVLIVDDSISMQKILVNALSQFKQFEVVGVASGAVEADRIRTRVRPDVISLDLFMPHEDGVAYLKRYRRRDAVPALVVSGISEKESGPAIAALDAGAFDWLAKPKKDEMQSFAKIYAEKLYLAYVSGQRRTASVRPLQPDPSGRFSAQALHNGLILIGSSTGGPEALRTVLSSLPDEIPPIVIIQHMPSFFTKAFAESLNESFRFDVKEATSGEQLRKNLVLIAPGGFQTKVIKGKYVDVVPDPPENLFCPSVDYTFRSALAKSNRTMIGVLLTGMGDDGARSLLKLKQAGVWTIVQDEETSVVFGMPKAAIEMGASCEVVPIQGVGPRLIKELNRQCSRRSEKINSA